MDEKNQQPFSREKLNQDLEPELPKLFQLITDYCYENSILTFEKVRDLIQRFCYIFSQESLLSVYLRLVEVKAASALEIQTLLDMPKQTVYRALNLLTSKGLIVKARPIKTGDHRPYTIYALYGYTADDIRDAYTRDQRIRTPGYRVMERASQLLMDDYTSADHQSETEIHIYLAEINAVVKRENNGFRWRDLTEGTRHLYIQKLTAAYPNKKLVIHAA